MPKSVDLRKDLLFRAAVQPLSYHVIARNESPVEIDDVNNLAHVLWINAGMAPFEKGSQKPC